MNNLFKQKKTVLFMGDSITDAGRTNDRPPYGYGFMAFFRLLVLTKYPGKNLNFINSGICGNTMDGLALRWEKDVLHHNPDILICLAGINDVFCSLNSDRPLQDHLNNFCIKLDTALTQSRYSGIETICLLTPFYAHTDAKDETAARCRRFADIVRQLAKTHNCLLFDSANIFDAALKQCPHDFWTTDRVHPREQGHMLLALKLLSFMETQ